MSHQGLIDDFGAEVHVNHKKAIKNSMMNMSKETGAHDCNKRYQNLLLLLPEEDSGDICHIVLMQQIPQDDIIKTQLTRTVE